MPSLIWTTVFLFLLLELAVTLILVLPVPRRVRNVLARNVVTKFNLGERLGKPILFVAIALSFALLESYVAHQRILARLEHEHGGGAADMYSQQHERVYHAQDKERKYKSERNMYLAGFSLTLLFVIGRILKLMQESVELEEEKDRVKTFVDDSNKKEVEAKSAEAKQANTTTSTTDKKKD
jgi:heme/copper-type cytochrome/quinol oxidase subunit 1